MALAAMVLLAAIPSMQRWRVRSRMSGDMQQVTGAVMTTRMRALQRGVATVLELHPGGGFEIRYGDDDDGNEVLDSGDVVGELRLHSLIELQVPSCYTLGSTTSPGVLFAPDGRVTSDPAGNGAGSCAVILQDMNGNRLRLLINSGSGTITRQMWDGSSWSNELRHWKF